MVTIPFVLFFIMLIWSIKNKGVICSSTLLLSVYTIISLGSILIDFYNIYKPNICPYIDIQIETVLVYCFLLLTAIIPFLYFKDEKIEHIVCLKNLRIIDLFVYFYAISLLLVIFLTYDDIFRNIILLQTTDNMKMRFRMGDEDIITLSGITEFIYNKWRFWGTASIFLCFYFYYSLAFLKKRLSYNLLILFGSLSCVYDGILHVDRSAITYWMMYFLLCFILFYRFISNHKKKKIKLGIFTIGFLFIAYIMFMNYSRFSSDEGSEYLLSYIGQSFINFSTFYQKLSLSDYSLSNNFPILNSIISPEMTRDKWNLLIEGKTGINTMVFSTFIGDMMAFIGPFYTMLWVIAFSILSFFLIKRNNGKIITVYTLFIFSVLFNVVYLGIFATYYHYANKELVALLWYFLFYQASQKDSVKLI